MSRGDDGSTVEMDESERMFRTGADKSRMWRDGVSVGVEIQSEACDGADGVKGWGERGDVKMKMMRAYDVGGEVVFEEKGGEEMERVGRDMTADQRYWNSAPGWGAEVRGGRWVGCKGYQK